MALENPAHTSKEFLEERLREIADNIASGTATEAQAVSAMAKIMAPNQPAISQQAQKLFDNLHKRSFDDLRNIAMQQPKLIELPTWKLKPPYASGETRPLAFEPYALNIIFAPTNHGKTLVATNIFTALLKGQYQPYYFNLEQRAGKFLPMVSTALHNQSNDPIDSVPSSKIMAAFEGYEDPNKDQLFTSENIPIHEDMSRRIITRDYYRDVAKDAKLDTALSQEALINLAQHMGHLHNSNANCASGGPVFIIDYIQDIELEGDGREQMTYAMRKMVTQFEDVAMESKVTFILLAQAQRSNKTQSPFLSETTIGDSKGIADKASMIYSVFNLGRDIQEDRQAKTDETIAKFNSLPDNQPNGAHFTFLRCVKERVGNYHGYANAFYTKNYTMYGQDYDIATKAPEYSPTATAAISGNKKKGGGSDYTA